MKRSITWQMNVSKKIKSCKTMKNFKINYSQWKVILMNRIRRFMIWNRNYIRLMSNYIQSKKKRNIKTIIIIRKVIIMKRNMKNRSIHLQNYLKRRKICRNRKKIWNEFYLKTDDFDLNLQKLKTVKNVIKWNDKSIGWTKR